jgi:transglutaminase-like putative cysteine protease
MIEVSKALADYARPSFVNNRSLKSCVSELTTRIFTEFTYDPASTTIATPLAEVLLNKRGVCQDFAHLQVGCLRALGIPAKYVSGYIETLPKPGEKKLVGADATHAWIAFFCPDEGWVEFDPTNNSAAGSQHIVTAFGRDFFDVTPLKGVIFGGGKAPLLHVSVDVSRILDSPGKL